MDPRRTDLYEGEVRIKGSAAKESPLCCMNESVQMDWLEGIQIDFNQSERSMRIRPPTDKSNEWKKVTAGIFQVDLPAVSSDRRNDVRDVKVVKFAAMIVNSKTSKSKMVVTKSSQSHRNPSDVT